MFRNLLNYPSKRPKPQDLVKKWKVVKGDTVQLIRGKDKGKKGIVTRVLRDRNKLVVEGLNLVKKHVKPSEQNKGGVLTKESPVHLSNVALLDPQDGKPTRVKWAFLPAGQRNMGEFTKKGRVRLSRRSNSIIGRPVNLGQKKKPKPKDGPKDTASADVLEKTYIEPDYLPELKAKRAAKKAKEQKKRMYARTAIIQKVNEIRARGDRLADSSIMAEAKRAVARRNKYLPPGSPGSTTPEAGGDAPAPPLAGGAGGAAQALGSIFGSRPNAAQPRAMRPVLRTKSEPVD